MVPYTVVRRVGSLIMGVVAIGVLVSIFTSCLSSEDLAKSAIDTVVAEATTLEASGDLSGSAVLYQQGLTEYPQSNRLLYNLGITFAKLGDQASSLTTLETLNELTGYSNTKYLKAYGGVAAIAGDFETAMQYWKTVVELDPLDFDSRERLMNALIDRQLFEEAYQYAIEAYELYHFEKSLFEKLAVLEVETGRGNGDSWRLIASSL